MLGLIFTSFVFSNIHRIGKSTLANVLLRLQDFDNGELLINGTDIRSLDPAEYHSHLTATMQNFVRYEASARDNVGVGYVSDLRSRTAVERAMVLGGADKVVGALPRGLNTMLDSMGTGNIPSLPCPMIPGLPPMTDHFTRQGLSGGEVCVSLHFRCTDNSMPLFSGNALPFHVPLCVHIEKRSISWSLTSQYVTAYTMFRPVADQTQTSALDSHAQARVFETIEQLSHPTSGARRKSVIFITHRLAIARRADKIIMLDNGSVSECGSHDDLIANDGPYASMYRASI
jgi:ABC-type oligopeptide transport system ATPase subunit